MIDASKNLFSFGYMAASVGLPVSTVEIHLHHLEAEPAMLLNGVEYYTRDVFDQLVLKVNHIHAEEAEEINQQ
jgi:hypothetical protein